MSQLAVPPTLRVLAERAVRYARRLAGFGGDEGAMATFLLRRRGRCRKTRNHFERSVGMLRREVVRALRIGDLGPKGSCDRGAFRTLGKDLRSASGCGRSEVACFVNAVCYAVTREVGAFRFPLITLSSGSSGAGRVVGDYETVE